MLYISIPSNVGEKLGAMDVRGRGSVVKNQLCLVRFSFFPLMTMEQRGCLEKDGLRRGDCTGFRG